MRIIARQSGTPNHDSARMLAHRVYGAVCPDRDNLPLALEIFEWVKASRITLLDTADLDALVQRWRAYQSERDEYAWAVRAFGG